MSVPDRLARVVSAHWFTTAVLVVIVANAVALGLETYAWIDERYGDELELVNDVCFAIFVVELMLRIGAYGREPWRFFRDGWNVFDFVVVAIAFVPGIRASSTLLRLSVTDPAIFPFFEDCDYVFHQAALASVPLSVVPVISSVTSVPERPM